MNEPEYPVCGNFTEIIYTNAIGDVIGCDCCLDAVDAWEWQDEQETMLEQQHEEDAAQEDD